MNRLDFLYGFPDGATVARQGKRVIDALQFRSAAARLAERLPATGHVANLCTDRYHIALTLAAALLRGVPCLMPPDRTRETLARVQRRFSPTWVVTRAEDGMESALVVDDGVDTEEAPDELAFPRQQTAVVMFTSGSTGEPQAHEKTWASLAEVGRYLGPRFTLERGDTVVATVPGQHMFGVEASIMLPLQNGASLVAGRPLFPEDVSHSLAMTPGARALVTTPVHLRACIGAGVTLPPLRFVLSATAPMDEALAGEVESATGAPVFEIYGCTEAGSVATRRLRRDPAWNPLPSLDLEFGKEDRCTVRADYLHEPIQLQDRIAAEASGRFRLLGRTADMVNIAGKRASLQDLTLKLLSLEGVEDAAFFVPEEGPSGQVRRLGAFVVAPGRTAAELKRLLRERVDPAFMPRPLALVDSLPRNEAGKLPRKRLEAMYRNLLGDGA
jgi:acyl-coenzyme A synthetase/AMP-(fatty) acid ligase